MCGMDRLSSLLSYKRRRRRRRRVGLRSWLRDLFARVLVARVFVIEGVRWRCVVGVEVYGGKGGGVWWKGWSRCVVSVGGVEVCGRE